MANENATTVDEQNLIGRYERLPFVSYFSIIILIVGVAAWFIDIMDLTASGVTVPAIAKIYHWNSFEESFALGAVFLGAFIGAISGGYLADKIGKKKILLYGVGLMGLGSLLTLFTFNSYSYWIFRTITGIGIGMGLTMGWAFLVDIVPSRARGRWFGLTGALGQSATPIIAFTSLGLLGISLYFWRYIYVITTIIALILFILVLFYTPESLRYYLAKGEYEKAKAVVEGIEKKVKKQYKKELPPPSETIYQVKKEKAPFSELFSKQLRRITALTTLAFVFSVVASYGFSAFLPVILIAKGFTIIKSVEYSALGYVGGIIGALFFSAIGDRIQRRLLLLIFLVVNGFLVLIFAFTINVIELVTLAFFIYFLNQAFGFAAVNYVPEVFPDRNRSTGSGFANGLGRLFTFATFVFLGAILKTLGSSPQLIMIFVFFVIGGILFYLVGVDANKKTVESYTEATASGHK